MGFFGKLLKKKDDFLGDSPPDFSQPLGQAQPDPFAANPYGNDPLQSQSPFGNDATNPAFNAQQPGSTFEHDIFSSDQPSNADKAREYARTLGNPQGAQPGAVGGPGTATYAGAITGHEAQLILERLDTIKAELDAIKQRMMHIERYMESAELKTGQRKYF